VKYEQKSKATSQKMESSLRWSSLSVTYLLSSEGTFFSNLFYVKKTTTLPMTYICISGLYFCTNHTKWYSQIF